MQNRTPPFNIEFSAEPKMENAVVIIGDDKFFPPGIFLARQIIELESYRNFDVCVLKSGTIQVPEKLVEGLRIGKLSTNVTQSFKTDDRISIEAYARIFLPDLMQEYKRILYLDADVFLRQKGLNELFAKDMGGFAIGAVKDSHLWGTSNGKKAFRKYTERLAKSPSEYFNSGVLLMDCKAYREALPYRHAITLIEDNYTDLEMHDQSFLNMVFSHRYKHLSPVFNFHMSDQYIDILEYADPVLLHFVSGFKPWYKTDDRDRKEYFELYSKFLKRHFGYSNFDIKIESHKSRFHRRKYRNKFREFLSRKNQLMRLALNKRGALKAWKSELRKHDSDSMSNPSTHI